MPAAGMASRVRVSRGIVQLPGARPCKDAAQLRERSSLMMLSTIQVYAANVQEPAQSWARRGAPALDPIDLLAVCPLCMCLQEFKEFTRSSSHIAHAAPAHLHNTWSSFAALQANRPSGAGQHGFSMRVNFHDACKLIYNNLQSPGVQCSALPADEPAMFANRAPRTGWPRDHCICISTNQAAVQGF